MTENEPPAQSIQSQGGQARAASLTPEQRTAIARKGAHARWSGPSHATYELPLSADGSRLVRVTAPRDLTAKELERVKKWLALVLFIG